MKNFAVASLIVCVIGLSWSQGVIVSFTPETAVLFPGDNVTFSCNISIGRLWLINDTTTRKADDELPDGVMSGGDILIITESANDTLYGCGVTAGGSFVSDTGMLYLAAPPNMVPGFMADISTIIVTPQPPTTPPLQISFTLNWRMPFDNFDPILNYTITIDCTGSECPVTLATDNSTTSLDVSYTTMMANHSLMITANNTVGTSESTMLEIVAPGIVRNIDVGCGPVDVINRCTVTWDTLEYSSTAIEVPIQYEARISGTNITVMSMTTDGSTATFDLPPVMSNIFVSVEASNVFGLGGIGGQVESEIESSAVQGTNSMLPDVEIAMLYDIVVECDISPSSSAEYCEVVARGPNSITTSTTINDDNMATVTVSGLQCAETYAITAGGIITTDGMVGQTLDGPRFHTETIVASVCPTIQTTTMLSTATTTTMSVSPTRTPGGTGSSSSDDSTGAIIGGVVGGIVVLILIIVIVVVLIYFCYYKDRDSGSRTMSPSGDKLPVTSAGAGAGAGRPTSVRVQTLDRYGKPMTDESDAGNVELTDYKPVGSPEFTVNQMPSGNNQLTTKEESRTPSSYMPEGSYDTLAPADEPQGQSAPLTQNGQDQPQKGKLNYAELEQFSRKPASVKKPETQPPSQYAVIDPKSLQGTYT